LAQQQSGFGAGVGRGVVGVVVWQWRHALQTQPRQLDVHKARPVAHRVSRAPEDMKAPAAIKLGKGGGNPTSPRLRFGIICVTGWAK
jgi:hypothetical protein